MLAVFLRVLGKDFRETFDVVMDVLLLAGRQGVDLGLQSISQELKTSDAAIAPRVSWRVNPVLIFDLVSFEEGALRAELEEGGLVFWSGLELEVGGARVKVTVGQICPGDGQELLQLGFGWPILGKEPSTALFPAPPFPLELGPSTEQLNRIYLTPILIEGPGQGVCRGRREVPILSSLILSKQSEVCPLKAGGRGRGLR